VKVPPETRFGVISARGANPAYTCWGPSLLDPANARIRR